MVFYDGIFHSLTTVTFYKSLEYEYNMRLNRFFLVLNYINMYLPSSTCSVAMVQVLYMIFDEEILLHVGTSFSIQSFWLSISLQLLVFM